MADPGQSEGMNAWGQCPPWSKEWTKNESKHDGSMPGAERSGGPVVESRMWNVGQEVERQLRV